MWRVAGVGPGPGELIIERVRRGARQIFGGVPRGSVKFIVRDYTGKRRCAWHGAPMVKGTCTASGKRP